MDTETTINSISVCSGCKYISSDCFTYGRTKHTELLKWDRSTKGNREIPIPEKTNYHTLWLSRLLSPSQGMFKLQAGFQTSSSQSGVGPMCPPPPTDRNRWRPIRRFFHLANCASRRHLSWRAREVWSDSWSITCSCSPDTQLRNVMSKGQG